MTVRFSTGVRNGLAGSLGFQAMFNQGYAKIFTGAQPATADAAETGTLLATVTSSSLALTKETRATGVIVITGAAGGSINTITVGGLNIVPDGVVAAVVGDTASTAANLCAAINRNGIMEASVAASTVTIKGRPGSGATTAAVSGSLTTVTATYGTGAMSGGVSPINGLIMASPSGGVISKPAPSIQIWSFTGVAIGTAGWMRLYSSDTADNGGLIAAAPWYPRMDGSVAVSGGDVALSNLSITVGSPGTVDRFTGTFPAQ